PFTRCSAPPTPPTEIDPRSLHDALPISQSSCDDPAEDLARAAAQCEARSLHDACPDELGQMCVGRGVSRDLVGEIRQVALGLRRSEEHTSELQSRENLVCRLLLEKKKQK